MRRVNILCVGKIKQAYISEGIKEYLKRLSRYCQLSIIELSDAEYSTVEQTRSMQSAQLLKRMKGFCILLDIEGELVDSVSLYKKIDKAYLEGNDTITFIIGGSDGVDSTVRDAASLCISFGRMTMPHQLIRLVLCEQIYRVFTIGENTPYHK